jgi:hypothetical protein
MSEMRAIEGLYEYDFDLSIRPDEHFSASRARADIERLLAEAPGVQPGDDGFIWRTSAGHHMEFRAELRRPDGALGVRTPNGEQVNCVHLFIPARARSAALEKGYFECALALAERLGWTLYDDTDSGCVVERGSLVRRFPDDNAKAPWWKLW